MVLKCDGCASDIGDFVFMECSQKECKKVFHVECLAWPREEFDAITDEFKKQWKCPECIRVIPKKVDSDTPVRGNMLVNQSFTPSGYVNTVRGRRTYNESFLMDSENSLMEELRGLGSEMRSRFDNQTEQFILLRNEFVDTKNELFETRKILTMFLEKAEKVDLLERKVKELTDRNDYLEKCCKAGSSLRENKKSVQDPKIPVLSFANTLKQNQKRVVAGKNNEFNVNKDEATKPANTVSKEIKLQKRKEEVSVRLDNTILDSEKKDIKVNEGRKILHKTKEVVVNSNSTFEMETREHEKEWTTVNRKKSRYPNSEVRRGERTNGTEIQGTERKKYLHIWRLQKDTTAEILEKYVKSLLEEGTPIKVEKIKQRTERDYASFIVGVPESKYGKLCEPENWALNIEYCEWVWFRRPHQKSGEVR